MFDPTPTFAPAGTAEARPQLAGLAPLLPQRDWAAPAWQGTVLAAPNLDLTLRIGCEVTYHVNSPATMIFNVAPLRDRRHLVLEEKLELGRAAFPELFTDACGNHFWRLRLEPGPHVFRHDAIAAVSSRPDNHDLPLGVSEDPDRLPPDLIRYMLPSRYCDSDKLAQFAWEKFGHIQPGLTRAAAISQWLHDNIEYRYQSGSPELSAHDILRRGYGVCRDFAHLVVALNRCFSIPARYVSGHLPDVGFPDPDSHMDFHAYGEVFIGGNWFTTDARFNTPRIGRVKVAHGHDAVDCAFSTVYGDAQLMNFQVWAYQVPRGKVKVGDPLDLSVRLDNRHEVVVESRH